MKKIIFLFIVISSFPAFAQKGTFKVNLVTGLNLALPVGPDAKQDRADFKKSEKEYSAKDGGSYSGHINPRLGIHLGGTVDYYITDKIAVTSGLIFSQRGYTRKVRYEYNTTAQIDYKKSYKKTTRVKLNYIDLPVMGKYFITNTFYVSAGLQFCFLASDKYIEKTEYNEIGYVDFEPVVVNKTEENISSAYAKGLLAGFKLGAGMTKEKIGLEFNISKTGVPLRVIGIPFGYPNLLIQCGLTYKIYTKNK